MTSFFLKLTLRGSVLSLDGEQCITDVATQTIGEITTSKKNNGGYLSGISLSSVIVPEHLKNIIESSEQCGVELGQKLLTQGASEILKQAREKNAET